MRPIQTNWSNTMIKSIKSITAACAWALSVATVNAIAGETPMLINFGAGGGWYEPATSGQGFSFDVVPESNQLVAYWFTYPEEGDAREWYTAQGDISGDSANLVIYQTGNGVFDQPSEIDIKEVGTAFMEYHSCQSATLDYFFDTSGASGQIDLKRLGTTRLCELFLTSASLEAVSHTNAWFNLQGEWFFEGCVLLPDGRSHGNEWVAFTETSMILEIEDYETPDCTGPMSLRTIDMQLQRVDKTTAFLNGEEVIANRYVLTDPASSMEIRQLWYVDDRGDTPVITHGVLDSPSDADGFPTQLHSVFFSPASNP
jgi:hypothetical protein